MREVLSELKTWTENKEEIALARSSRHGVQPRPLGSKMVVTRSGKMAARLERLYRRRGVRGSAEGVESARAKVAAFGVADDVAFSWPRLRWDIEVFIQPFAAVHEQLIELLDENRPATLRTNLVTGEATSRKGRCGL